MVTGVKPQLIGNRYELQDLLGQGGMGAVHCAYDRLTGQTVALKRVLATTDTIEDDSAYNIEDFRLALAREFKLLASLRHPHIIEVLDYGFDDMQQPYFTMELLREPQNIIEAGTGQALMPKVNLIVQTLRALAYLHRRGILHRDLKPANVLVSGGRVKVLDFGLSVMRDRVSSEEDDITVGTLGYMAPEILIGHPASEYADLYATGMMAYEILAEKHPFLGNDPAEMINHILQTLPDFDELDIDLALTNVIRRALQKDPGDRYSSALEFVSALDTATKDPVEPETIETRESYLQGARLVGRDAELKQLQDSLAEAAEGRGGAWLIGGESGVGKSRIVDEIRTQALVNGALVMRGQALSEGRRPYHIWHSVLRWLALLRDLDRLEAGLIKMLVNEVVTLPDYDLEAAEELESQRVQARLLETIEETLHQQKRTVVIILEDLHWANSESIALLSALAKAADDLPLLIIGSYRDDERADLARKLSHIPVMKLNRLAESSIAELSREILGAAGAQPHVVHLLQRETEGNVFFLIEVVRALAEEAGQLDQIGRSTLPQSVFAGGVDRIIRRRLNALPERAYGYLEIAAIIGRRINFDLIQAVVPEIRLDKWLMECANAAVLEVLDNEWRFAHDKLRDAVLKHMDRERCKRINQQVAESIERLYDPNEYAPALAHHWRMAEIPQKEALYTTIAGGKALQTGAYQEAISYFDRGLALASYHGERVQLQHRKAEAHLGLGEYEAAKALYEASLQASQQINDRPNIARSLYSLGEVAYARADHDTARRHYEQSLALYRQLGDRAGVARALNSLGNVAYDSGEAEQARELYQQSLNISRELGSQWGMAGSLGIPAATQNETETEAERARITQTLEIYTGEDNKRGIAQAHYELGDVAFAAQDFTEARQQYTRSLRLWRELNDMTGVLRVFNRLGTVSLETADYDEAQKYLSSALQAVGRSQAVELRMSALLGIAKLCAYQNRPQDAVEILSFILNGGNQLSDNLEDEAERLVFGLEEDLEPAAMETAWEQGKSATFQEFIEKFAHP